MFRQSTARADEEKQMDRLSAALSEQQNNVMEVKRKQLIALVLFYLYTTVSAGIDLPDLISQKRWGFCAAFSVTIAAGIVILIAYCRTQSRRWANLGTFLYVMSLDLCRIFSGKNGLLGIVEVMVCMAVIFRFMDIPYAAVLNYSLLFFKTIVFFGFVAIPHPRLYSEQTVTWYLFGSFMMTGISHWYAYTIRQISTYRDKSLSLAGQYCSELLISIDNAEKLRIVAEEARDEAERSREEAILANQAKSQFLSSMSHDIRTPINAIAGYAAMAKLHLDDTKKVEDCLNKIETSETHLNEIINDCLDMSRIENGKDALSPKPVSLSRMCQEITSMMQPAAERGKLTLETDESAIHHDLVLADSAKLRRILVNIIGNAVKYTKEGGLVTCSVTEEASGKDASGRYRFQVRDTGIGMSEEYLSHVFEPFSREESARSCAVTGTGLGMSIAKKYSELMGGHIEIKSKEGQGTTVTVIVELPFAKHEEEEKQQTSSGALRPGMHVLYVDDSSMNCEIAKELLESIGVTTETAMNGQEALDCLDRYPAGTFDVVLMDMLMPVMDGLTAARRIRASRRDDLKQIPIIAVTANAFAEDEQACREAGMNDFLTKPFTAAEFRDKLSRF